MNTYPYYLHILLRHMLTMVLMVILHHDNWYEVLMEEDAFRNKYASASKLRALCSEVQDPALHSLLEELLKLAKINQP